MTNTLNIPVSQVVGGSDPQNNPKAFNVDNLGNIQSSSTDIAGRQSFNTVFGSAITSKKIDEVLVKFNLGINLALSTPVTANGGTVGESNSRLLLSSSISINGMAKLESNSVVRYRPGHEMFCYFTAGWLNGGILGATQNIGIFDSENGYFIGFNGVDFRVSRRKNSIDNEVSQSNFNLDTIDGKGLSKFNLDTTKINIFRITFGYLGMAPAIFEVYAGTTLGRLPFHVIDLTNISSELTIENPDLPITSEIIKTFGNTDIKMVSGSWNGGFYGGDMDNLGNIPFQYNTDKGRNLTGVGNENIVVLRLKSTFNGKTNKVRVENVAAQFENDSNDVILAHITANPTTIGGVDVNTLTYTDVNIGSTMEIAEGGTGGAAVGEVVGGNELFTRYMIGGGQGSGAFSGGASFNAQALGLIGKPGDVFAISYERVTGSGALLALTTLNWVELF